MQGNQGMQRRELMQWFVRCLVGRGKLVSVWKCWGCTVHLGIPSFLVLRQEFWGLEGLNGQSPKMTLINRLDILCNIYIYICACVCVGVCVFRLWKHLGPQLNTFRSFFHWLIDSYQRPHLNNHYIHQWPKWTPFVVPWLSLVSTLKPPSNQVDGSSLFTPVQQPWARPDVKPKERGRRLAGP